MIRGHIKRLLDLRALKTDRKLILFLSDDWGSVRMKSVADQRELVKKGFRVTNRFDQYDGLETNEDLELLFEVLVKYRDIHGNHPVITAVSNVANPDFERIKASGFNDYYFESTEQTCQRYPDSDRVMTLVREGIDHKIFIPQSHGREHLQVNWWLQELKDEKSYARRFFEQEFFFLNPLFLNNPRRQRGIGAAFDVWNEQDLVMHKEIIQSGLDLFETLYSFKSLSFTPPAIFYSPVIESALYEQGIKWLDVGRFFKVPLIGGGERWQYNYLGKRKKSGLRVLVRNAMFESNISENDNGVDRCLHDVEQAFKARQPAIISNHRASFAGRINKENSNRGIKALDQLLNAVIKRWPDVEFVTVSDL